MVAPNSVHFIHMLDAQSCWEVRVGIIMLKDSPLYVVSSEKELCKLEKKVKAFNVKNGLLTVFHKKY